MIAAMRNWRLAFALAVGIAQPALAQAAEPEQAVPAPLWSLALSGALSMTDSHGGDQTSAQISLTRSLGAGFAGLSLARLDTPAAPGQVGALDAKTDQLTLSGGAGFGALSFDAYAAYGWRKFDSALVTAGNGQTVAITGKGKTLSAGGSITYELPLGDHAALAPFVSID
jgi:Autotransporter beta-domain